MTLASGIPAALADIVGADNVTFTIDAGVIRDQCPDYVGTLPDAVVCPGSRDELVEIIRGAAASDVSVRTHDGSVLSEGESGQIAVSLRRLDRILRIDRHTLTARLQPAIPDVRLLQQLHAAGYRLGAPVRTERHTRWRPSDCVVAAEVVTASGEVLRATDRGCIELLFRATDTICLLTELTVTLLPLLGARRRGG